VGNGGDGTVNVDAPEVALAGAIDIADDTDIAGTSSLLRLYPYSILEKTGTTPDADTTSNIGIPVRNDGAIEAFIGELRFAADQVASADTGTWRADVGGELTLAGTQSVDTGTAFTGGGTLRITGLLEPADGSDIEVGDGSDLTLDGGSLDGGSYAIDGQGSGGVLTWTGVGGVGSSGTLSVGTNLRMVIAAGSRTLSPGRTLDISGTLELQGSGTLEDAGAGNPGAAIKLESTGVMTHTGGAGADYNEDVNDVEPALGSIIRSESGTMGIGQTGIPGGLLPAMSSSAHYDAANGANLDLMCGTFNVDAATQVTTSGSGEVRLRDDIGCGDPYRPTIDATGDMLNPVNIAGTLSLVSGVFNTGSGADLSGSGKLALDGDGTIVGQTVTFDPGFHVDVDTVISGFHGDTLVNHGTVTLHNGTQLEDNGASSTFDNQGTLVADGLTGSMFFDQFYNDGGTVESTGGGELYVLGLSTPATETGTWASSGAGSYVEVDGATRTWGDNTISAGSDVRFGYNGCCSPTVKVQDGRTVTVNGTLTQQGMPFEWDGTGHVAGSGEWLWTGGAQTGSGTMVVDSGAHVRSLGSISGNSVHEIDNLGTWTMDDQTPNTVTTLDDDPATVTFVNEPGGHLLGKAVSTAEVQMGLNGFQNQGTVEAVTGAIRMDSGTGGTQSGTFTADSGATVHLTYGTFNLTDATVFNGAGTILVNNDWGSTTLSLNGSSPTIAAGTTVMLTAGTLSGSGAAGGTGHVHGGGTLELAGAGIDPASNVTVDAGATVQQDSNITMSANPLNTITNDGTWRLMGDAHLDDSGADAAFLNYGTLTHDGNGTACECLNLTQNESAGTVENVTGSLQLGATTDGGNVGQDGGGTYDAAGGEIRLDCGTWNFDGNTVVTAAAGAVVLDNDLGCGGLWPPVLHLAGSGGSPVQVNGSLVLRAGTVAGSDAHVGGTGTVSLTGAGLDTSFALTTGSALTAVVAVPTTLGSRQDLTNGGTLHLNAGLTTTDTLENGAGGDIVSGSGSRALNGPVQNDGTISESGGTLAMNDLLNLDAGTGTLTGGSYKLDAGALRLTNLDDYVQTLAASLELDNDAALERGDAANTLWGLATITSTGTLTLDNENSSVNDVNTFFAPSIANSGHISLDDGGYLASRGTFTNDGTITVCSSCSLSANDMFTQHAGETSVDGTLAGNDVTVSGGTLSGGGIVNTGLVTQTGGTVAPEGMLTMNRDFVQTGGTLLVHVAGSAPTYDSLWVRHSDSLTDVTVASGTYVPQDNLSLPVVASPSGTSTQPTFHPVDELGVPIAGEWWFVPTYADGSLNLDTRDLTPPAGPTGLDSGNHTVGVPSWNTAVLFHWTAATDQGTGLGGYRVWVDETSGPEDLSGGLGVPLSSDATSYSVRVPSGDATYYVHVQAYDVHGNWGTSQVAGPYRIDNTAPDVSITAGPADQGFEGTGSPAFTFSSTDADGPVTFACSLDDAPATACTSGSTVAGAPLQAGQHTFTVSATDAAGNVSTAPATRTFTTDLDDPTVSLSDVSGPAASLRQGGPSGQVWFDPSRDGSMTLSFAASDPTSGVAQVAGPDVCPLACATPGKWTQPAAVTSAPYDLTYSWTAGADFDANVLQADVTDGAGRTAQGDVQLFADSTDPDPGTITYDSVVATAPTDVQVSFGGASDADSGLGQNELQIAQVAGSCSSAHAFDNATWVVVGVNMVSPYSAHISSDGCYRFRLKVTDNVGRTTYATSANTVLVDQVGPSGSATISESSPYAFVAANHHAAFVNTAHPGALDAVFNVVDTGSGVGSVDAPVLGSGWSTAGNPHLVSAPYAEHYTWAAGAASPGAVSASAHDVAGNAGSVPFSVTADTTAPSGAITAPASANTSASLTGTDSDGGSGVGSVTVTYAGPASGTACSVAVTPTWSCTWRTSALAAGTYTLRLTVTDNVGNATSATKTVAVRHDFTPPVAKFLGAASAKAAALLKALAVSVSVNEKATAHVDLVIAPVDAKRLGLGVQHAGLVIGSASGGPATGALVLKGKLNPKGAAALKKLGTLRGTQRTVRLTLRLVATDVAGNVAKPVTRVLTVTA
jgi:hypothetical protein